MLVWITDKGKIEQVVEVPGSTPAIVTYEGPTALLKGAEYHGRKWFPYKPIEVYTGVTIVLCTASQ